MKTDDQVQKLFKVVQAKKEEIQKAEKPNWLTNCSFGYDDEKRYNIQVVSKVSELVSMLAFLLNRSKTFDEAAAILGANTDFSWMGFSLEEWMSDLKTRITKIQISQKKKELEVLEARLSKLISPELRAQLELEEITKELGL